MRFSPVLLAVLAATATLGLAYPAKAQSSEADLAADTPGSNLAEETEPQDWSLQVSQGASSPAEFFAEQPAIDQLTELETLTVSSPEGTSIEFFSQVPVDPASGSPVDTEVPGDESQPPQTPDQPELTLPLDPDSLPEEEDLQIEDEAQPDSGQTEEDAQPEETETETETEETAPVEATPAEPATPEDSVQPTTEPPAVDSDEPASQAEPRVLVAEVAVTGAEAELQDEVYRVIRTRPGRTTTRSQLQEDINAVFATGFFSNVRAVPEDTPLGVRITFDVAVNPPLQSVQLSGSVLETIEYEGAEVPIQQAVDDIFAPQYGTILNLRDLQQGVEQLNQLYQSNGYVLAQVVGAPQISPDGVVTLEVAEGVVEDIQIRFLNKDGESVDDEGEPIRGRTRDFIITREFETQPGDVFNQNQIQADLQRAFGLGIFEDLNISLNPGQDPRQVDLVVNVTERSTGSFAAGVGISSASGFFGTVSLQEQNLGGNNQRVNFEAQVGQRDLLFDLSFTDPWIGGDPNRTSYSVNAFARQSRSLVFEGDDEEIRLPNGDRPRIRRFGGGVTFGRPLGDGWQASLGAQYQQVTIRDLDGEREGRSEYGTNLAFNESGLDDLFTLEFTASRDRRNDPIQATSGSFLRLSTEQSIPIGNGSIFFNRLRGSYSYFLPIRFTNFTAGCRLEDPSPNDCPQTLAFNVQGGTFIGDLPPYEAFTLGGTDSIRGYDAGDVASARSFVQATVEYRFPIIASIVGGALFADIGTDLGTQEDVPGEPGVILDKPGFGFGYGVGVRVQSPVGQIRVDYAINDEGDSRIHFGIGERF